MPDGAEECDFGAAWPMAQDRLARVLRARGAQPADVDDIGQEVACRALRDAGRFTSEEHLVRWSCRVAINLYIDGGRRQLHLSSLPLPDGASRDDTSSAVERRMALAAVMTEVRELSDDDRELLLDGTTSDSRREAVRLAVRRHRLRARLALLTEGLLGVAGWIAGLRRLTRGRSTAVNAALVAVPVVAVLAMLPFISMLQNSPGGGSGSQYQPADAQPRVTLTPASKPAVTARPVHDRAQPTASASSPSRTFVDIKVAGTPLVVRQVTKPDTQPTLCESGYVNFCIARPKLALPESLAGLLGH